MPQILEKEMKREQEKDQEEKLYEATQYLLEQLQCLEYLVERCESKLEKVA